MPRILEPDAQLVRAILPQLAEIETELAMGESGTVQPYDREHCRHGQIKVDGYNFVQIDEALRFLVQEAFVDVGGVSGPALGIQFVRLTRAGRDLLARAGRHLG